EQRSPVLALERLGPALRRRAVDAPGLDLADVVGRAGLQDQVHAFPRLEAETHVELARLILRRLPLEPGADVLVRRDVEEPRLRTVRRRRPVLASPGRRTEVDPLAGHGFVREVVLGPAGLRIQPGEHVLVYVGLRVDEADRVLGALEEPQVAV